MDTFGTAVMDETPNQGVYLVYRVVDGKRQIVTHARGLEEAQVALDAVKARIAFARENAIPVGTVVKVGKGEYRITGHRYDDHPKFKGEFGYNIQGLRNGKDFGPMRITRHSNVTL